MFIQYSKPAKRNSHNTGHNTDKTFYRVTLNNRNYSQRVICSDFIYTNCPEEVKIHKEDEVQPRTYKVIARGHGL